MTERKPPRLAVWLLKRPGVSRENEALLGDLVEEFENGRRNDWFWRQTLGAFRLALARVLPGLALNLVAVFIAWMIPFGFFETLLGMHLLGEHVPFGSLYQTNMVWPFIGLMAGLEILRNYLWRQRSRELGFGKQIYYRIIAWSAVSCVYLLTATWVGWVGWSGMCAFCAVNWFRDSAETFGTAFRRFCYQSPSKKPSQG